MKMGKWINKTSIAWFIIGAVLGLMFNFSPFNIITLLERLGLSLVDVNNPYSAYSPFIYNSVFYGLVSGLLATWLKGGKR